MIIWIYMVSTCSVKISLILSSFENAICIFLNDYFSNKSSKDNIKEVSSIGHILLNPSVIRGVIVPTHELALSNQLLLSMKNKLKNPLKANYHNHVR